MNDSNVTKLKSNKFKEKKTILILGISSFVGSNLAELLKNDYKIIGTFYSTAIRIKGVLNVHCDLMDRDSIQMLMYTFKPDYTIFAAGKSGLKAGHDHPGEVDTINTNTLFSVVDFCQRYKSRLLYFSTHHVFAGKEDKRLLEMDIPDPITQYGKSKTSAEFFIQKNSLNYIVFRGCQFYGRGYNLKSKNFFEHIQHTLHHHKTIACDDIVQCGFLDIYYLAMIVKLCIEKDVQNRLFQICSEDVMSYYDFAKTYCEVFNSDSSLLTKTKWNYPILPNSNIDTFTPCFHMDIGNVSTYLNLKLPSIKESLEFTYKRFHGPTSKARGQSSEGIKFI